MPQAIKDIVEGLKTQPLALALVIVMLTMLWLFYHLRQKELDQAHAQQQRWAELLAQCARPQQ